MILLEWRTTHVPTWLDLERDQERRVYQANGTPTALPRTVFRLNTCVVETDICKQTCEDAALVLLRTYLDDHVECSCVGRAARILLSKRFFEVVPVASHVLASYRRPSEHQCLPADAVGVANGVDEELKVLFAELGCRGTENGEEGGRREESNV